jgi:hypothetical protein
MRYKQIEYFIRARPGRDQWTLAISYPQKSTEIEFSGSRDEAITAVCRKIDDWLKSRGRQERGDKHYTPH